MLVAIVLAVAVAVVDWFRLSVSLPVAGASTTILFAGLALLLVAYRAVNPPGDGSVEREPALYLGIGCLLGMILASLVAMGETSPKSSATAAGPS